MEHGMALKRIGKAALISGACGIALAALIAWMDGSFRFGLILLISPFCLIYPGVVGLLACFRIRVRGGYVEHVFLGRFLIQRRRLSRFVGVEANGDDPEVVFEGGKTLRIMGPLSQHELAQMEQELRALSLAAKAAEQAGCDRPPRPVAVASEWLLWQDGTVRKLAEALSREQRLDHLAVLADALEDAGCADDVLLSHLRSPGPHVCGCWAIDLILGK